MLPSLNEFGPENDDEDEASVSGPQSKKFRGVKKTSTLLSLLPSPKNGFPSRMSAASAASAKPSASSSRMMVPDSVSRKPAIPASLIPRQVKAKAKAKAKKSGDETDSDSDDDAPTSFFTLESEKSRVGCANKWKKEATFSLTVQ